MIGLNGLNGKNFTANSERYSERVRLENEKLPFKSAASQLVQAERGWPNEGNF